MTWKEITNEPWGQRFAAECVAEEMQIEYNIDIIHAIFAYLKSDKCLDIMEDIAREYDCCEEMEELIRTILD